MISMSIYYYNINNNCSKFVIISFYAFREIYVSLISSQQWAFIATTLNKTTSSYIVCFSGIVSIAGAFGGCSIEQLVNYGGVSSLLITSSVAILCSYLCAECSYFLIDNNSSNNNNININQNEIIQDKSLSSHSDNNKTETKTSLLSSTLSTSPSVATITTKNKKSYFLIDSWNLILKYPLLQILFLEGLSHQLCTNMLNLMFHNCLRIEIFDDSIRAMLVGRFFAIVNITACILQLFILPTILSYKTLPYVICIIPIIIFISILFGIFYPSLILVMFGFGTIKVLEYSIMHSASEMIYMPMGHEVRYVGKELIRYFGHKLGKSGISIICIYIYS
jgi:ATP/ADP translocase